MITQVPYPRTTGVTLEEQVKQLSSYLFQLTDILNFALGEISRELETIKKDIAENKESE